MSVIILVASHVMLKYPIAAKDHHQLSMNILCSGLCQIKVFAKLWSNAATTQTYVDVK